MPGQSRAPLIVIPVLVLALAAPVSAGDRVDRPGLDPARGYDLAVEAMRRGDYSLARSYLDPVVISPRLSRKGRARAYHLRGLTFYRDGLYVSAGQDYRRALEFFPTLAEARNALAWLRLKGRGLKRDPARAVQLYRLAARQGHVESSFNLALLLMKGTGGPADPREALGWFQAAADADHAEAAALAGQILARGLPPTPTMRRPPPSPARSSPGAGPMPASPRITGAPASC